MGCCFSSGKASGSAMAGKKKKKNDSHSKPDFSNVQSGAMNSRGAPPLMEEESVKEVLSETPTPKPPPLTTPIVQLQRETQAHEPIWEKMKGEMARKRQPMNEAEEKSEISEVCSLIESLSTVNTDENEEGHKKTYRSPAKLMKNRTISADLEPKKEWVVTASPNRRPYQLPGRSYSSGGRSLKMVQNRDSSHGPAVRGLRSEAHRGDPYEKSSRRSKSPAATRSDNSAMRPAMGQSPSIRRVGRSPSRSAASPHHVGKNREENELKERTPAANDSLDNPLVSLECFIFL